MPTTVSEQDRGDGAGPSTISASARCCRARWVSSASLVAWKAAAVRVRAPELDDAGHAGLARPTAGVAGERDRAAGAAVVAAVGGQHLAAAGVQAGHAHRVLGGLRAAVGEERPCRGRRRATSLISRAASLRAALAWTGAIVHSWSACSLIAATSLGCWWPMLTLTSWLEKSRKRVPSSVPEAAALGTIDDDRVERTLCAPGVEDVARSLVKASGHAPIVFVPRPGVQTALCTSTFPR